MIVLGQQLSLSQIFEVTETGWERGEPPHGYTEGGRYRLRKLSWIMNSSGIQNDAFGHMGLSGVRDI